MDTKEIWQEYKKTRSVDLRNQLIEEYTPLAEYHASAIYRLVGTYIEKDDLLQEARIGLMQAVERFDPDKGFRFTSFAGLRIRGAIIDSIRDGGDLERHKQAALFSLGDGTGEDLQRRAEDAGMEHKKVMELLNYYRMTHPASLSNVVRTETAAEGKVVFLSDTLVCRYDWVSEVNHEDFFEFIYRFLSLKQKFIIENVYEYDINRQILAKALGITEQGLYFQMRKIWNSLKKVDRLRGTLEDHYSYAC